MRGLPVAVPAWSWPPHEPRRRSPRRPRLAGPVALVTVALALLGACDASSRDVEPAGAPAGAVRVGSLEEPESVVVAELLAQSLERSGIPVERVGTVGPREVAFPALAQDHVDLLPDSVGSALAFVTGTATPSRGDPATSAALLGNHVRRLGVDVVATAPAESGDAVAVRASTARALGLRTLGDLAGHAGKLTFAAPAACLQRPWCLPGLQRVYGIGFAEVRTVPAGPPAAIVVAAGGADAAGVRSNDPGVRALGLVVLDDDRALYPAENLVALLRAAAGAAHPGARPALSAVLAALDARALERLTDAAGPTAGHAAEAARDFLAGVPLPAAG